MSKFLLFILSVLFSMAGYSQAPVIINSPYDFQKWVKVKDSLRAARITPDSTLQLPTGCGVPSGTASLKGSNRKKSAIFRDSCGKKTYIFEPSDSTWSEVGGGGGGGDSTIFATKYGVDTAKTNIRTQIAGKQPTGNYITALIGDVTAEGPGSVPGTISNNAVTTPKILDSNVTSAKIGAFSPYPAEYPWKTIYERTSWPDLADFSPQGTAVLGLTGAGLLTITAATEDYTPKVLILPGHATGLPNWKMTFRYRHTSFGSPSNWFGAGIKSKVDHDGANFGYMFFTGAGSGGGGNSFFSSETGSVIENSGAGVSKSVNDLMEATIERRDTVMEYTLRNVTTSSATQTVPYTFPNNNSNILPNVGNWFFMYNANGGVVQVEYLKIETPSTISPNLELVGNSKTVIASTSFSARPANQLQATYPTVIYSAGSAERMQPDMFFKKEELLRQNPAQVILVDVWSNDKRSGLFTDQQIIDNIIKLENYWQAGGTKVFYAPLPEDSTAGGANGLTYFWQWLTANRSPFLLPTWDSLRRSPSDNRIKAEYTNDGVHLTLAGNNKIVQSILASNKISTISPHRRTDRRTVDNNVRTVGDSTTLAFDWSRVANNVPRITSSYNVSKSNIWDDATNVIVSTTPNPTAPIGAILFNVNGATGSYGNIAGSYVFDRDNPAKYFLTYGNASVTRFNRIGNDIAGINDDGKWVIGTSSELMVYKSSFRIKQSYSFAATQAATGFGLSLDTVTYTTSAGTNLGDGARANIAPTTMVGTGSPSTYDNFSSLHIDAPVAGSLMTITNPWALNVNSGAVRFGSYGAGIFTVTPATTPVYSSSGKIGERIAPKIYTALLSQSSTSDPTATVLGTNEVGAIVWTRNSPGNYTATLSGAFTANKTWLIVQRGDQNGGFLNNILSWTSANALLLTVQDNTATPVDGFTNMSIEIRVFP